MPSVPASCNIFSIKLVVKATSNNFSLKQQSTSIMTERVGIEGEWYL